MISILRAVAAVMVILLVPTSASGEPVSVRAAVHDGYGRIVFNWDRPVRFSADVEGQLLTVRFENPIEPDFRGVTRILRKYIRNARAGADGRSVVFTLIGTFPVRNFDLGTMVIIDLLESDTRPQPDKTAQIAAQAPIIKVRAGEHQGYSRIVFDWRRKAPYQVDQQPGTAVVTFSRPAQVNLGRLKARLPKNVRKVSSRLSEKDLEVTFALVPGARIKHFYSGSKVVIDILAPQPAMAITTPTETRSSAPTGTQQAQTQPQDSSVVRPEAAEPVPEKAAETPVATARPKSLIPVKTVDAPTPKTTPETTSKTAGQQTEIVAKPSAPSVEDKIAEASGDAVKPVSISSIAPSPSQEEATPSDQGVSLRFEWIEPVAAAVFKRAGWIWVVFDVPVEIDLRVLREAGGDVVTSIEQLPSRDAVILRLSVVPGVNPEVRRDGLAWILNLRKQEMVVENPIEPRPQPDAPAGGRLFMSVVSPGTVIALHDPETEDNLAVVPVIPLSNGFSGQYKYPQFNLLPTIQGIAIRPLVDDLNVRSIRQGVELTAESGLSLSAVSEAILASSRLGPGASLTQVLNLSKWEEAGVENFSSEKRFYQRAVALVKKEDAGIPRMNLARFYFANRFAAEALGVLQVLVEAQPEYLDDPEFHALLGASNFLMNRLDEAQSELDHPSLKENDEAAFWRAAILAGREDKEVESLAELTRTSLVMRRYPRPLKMTLSMMIARTAIKAGETRLAEKHIEVLSLSDPNRAQRSEITFLEGRLAELSGDFDNAVAIWEKLINGTHRPSRAQASRARTELLYKLNRITRLEAIEELEGLRFAWRGDEFEFGVLRRLGRMYIEEKEFRDALRTLRQAATYFRTHEDAPLLTQEMANAFRSLYLEGAADSLPPVTAIALYEEFKELTPPNDTGDEMIRKLADRLVAVDLLDQATALLDSQVQYRLEGVDKARVGARLALVHMINRKLDMAIKVLDSSDDEGLPEALIDQRRHLKARALAGLKKGEEALVLLENDRSIPANEIRATIYWQGRDWNAVTKVVSRLLRASGAEPSAPLDEKQSGYVLSLAVSLTMTANEVRLVRLREDFGDQMASSPLGDAFRLIASSQSQGLMDYRMITEKVAEAEGFQSFMNQYKDRLKASRLSSIN